MTAALRALATEVCQLGRAAGLDAVGIATAEPFDDTRRDLESRKEAGLAAGMAFTYRNPARSTDPRRALPGAQALVVGARRYVRAAPEEEPPIPTGRVARYSWVDHYAPLRASLAQVAERLQADGWHARVLADDNALVDRAAAYRAGLGWYGRNTTLLLPGAGSWFVLGSVVTNAPLPPSDSPVPDGCGHCRRCLPACPTGALVAPGMLDARRCLAWLVQAPGVFPVEYREALGDRLYGCDDCQEVCPINVRAARGDPPPAAEADAEAVVDVLELLGATDDELLTRWGRWYIPARQPRYLRRNALLVLANTADPADSRARDAVARALDHPDGLVRAHAVWAAGRLGHTDLLAGREDDPAPEVHAEMARFGIEI